MLKKCSLQVIVLSLYIMLLPISTGLAGIIGDISILNYIVILYVFISCIKTTKLKYKKSKIIVFCYLIYTTISMTFNYHFQFDWYISTFLLNFMLLLFSLSHDYNYYEKELIIKSVLASFFVVFFVTIFNLDSALNYRLRIKISSVMDPNDIACGLILIISTMFSNIMRNRKKYPIAVLGGCLFIIILSGSRGGIITFLSIFIVWVYNDFKQKKLIAPIIIILTCLLLYIITYEYLPDYLIGRMDLHQLANDGGSGRILIWKAAIREFASSSPLRMLIGNGYGSFQYVVNYIAVGHNTAYISHNMWINSLIETGIIGLLLMISMFVKAYIISKKNNNYIGQFAIVGLAVAGCTLDMQSYRIFAMVILFSYTSFMVDEKSTLKPSVNETVLHIKSRR